MKVKTLGKITFWSITLLLAFNLFLINLKPEWYERYIYYKENAVIFEYPRSDYDGILIPDDVRLFFVKNVDSIDDNWFDFFKKDNDGYTGTYNQLNKKIQLVFDRNNEDIKKTLIHELAHYTYYNNLTDYQKQRIENEYNHFCKDKMEFYAETIERYDYFNYN